MATFNPRIEVYDQDRAAFRKEQEDRVEHAKLNTSGIKPLDQRVLVKPDSAERRTPGGIILPDETVEKDEWAMQKGTLVAVGACAWAEAKAMRGFEAPEPAARVIVGKYAGSKLTGTDGEKYLVMNDEDVIGVLEEG